MQAEFATKEATEINQAAKAAMSEALATGKTLAHAVAAGTAAAMVLVGRPMVDEHQNGLAEFLSRHPGAEHDSDVIGLLAVNAEITEWAIQPSSAELPALTASAWADLRLAAALGRIGALKIALEAAE